MSLHNLKPCPFCGGEAGLSSVGTSYMAHCYTPNCIMEVTPYFASVENAVDAWNKRADEGNPATDENRKSGESAFDDVNPKWLSLLLTFLSADPPRREITVRAESGGKSVNITYDPHDAEAAKAAETWRNALFAGGAQFKAVAPIAVNDGDSVTFAEPPRKEVVRIATKMRMDELCKASEPLRAYLKAHGDPYTSVIVTQYGATETQDERRVTFVGEKPAETVKRGRWEKSDIPNEEYVCSVCGGACWYYGYNGRLGKSRYCPNCGARMEDVT